MQANQGPGDMPVLEVLSHAHEGQRFPIGSLRVVIGNREDADISLSDPWVSFEHAEVYARGATWWIEDLGSSNGTYLDRQRVRSRAELKDGAMVLIGQTVCRFNLSPESEKPLTEAEATRPTARKERHRPAGTMLFRVPNFSHLLEKKPTEAAPSEASEGTVETDAPDEDL